MGDFANGATEGNGCSVYISGDVLYSYGSHYPLAVRKDDGTFVINVSGYSVSTSKHIHYARSILHPSHDLDVNDIRRWLEDKKVKMESMDKIDIMKKVVPVLTNGPHGLNVFTFGRRTIMSLPCRTVRGKVVTGWTGSGNDYTQYAFYKGKVDEFRENYLTTIFFKHKYLMKEFGMNKMEVLMNFG